MARQFITRTNQNKDVIVRFEEFITDYFNSDKLKNNGIPTVKYCAEAMNLSPNYFSDLLKSETGKNTQEHIHYYLLEKAKTLLVSSDKSINEIAYELGFEYPQSFSKLFKKKLVFHQQYIQNSINTSVNMKAIVYKKYGSPDVLEPVDLEKPTPKANEVLIRVYATTVTTADCMMRRGDTFLSRILAGISQNQ